MEEMFSSLICFHLFFLYISFGTFFGQGIAPASQRGVKQCNQNMESDILRQHSLALSPWPSKAFKLHMSDLYIFPCIFIILSDSTKSTISPYIYIYIYIFYIYMGVSLYIYIYIERERERNKLIVESYVYGRTNYLKNKRILRPFHPVFFKQSHRRND